MLNSSNESWSLCIGRWRGVDVRLHIQLPLLALLVLVVAVIHPLSVQIKVACWAVLVLVVSVALHELVRVWCASRLGGHADSIMLGPVGGWTKLHLPVDPPAHLITALVGPLTFFVLLVAAGCGLALADDRYVHHLLLRPHAPDFNTAAVSQWMIVGQLVVWVNWCLLLISLLPIDPCAGAELLRGVLWPVVGRTTATTVTSHVALGAALLALLLALVLLQRQSEMAGFVPSWFPLAVTSLFLLYGGRRQVAVRRYDVGLAIDELDSDDEQWLSSEWLEEDRKAVLVEHLQDKQQDVLDRKRREREASEDARVDAILARMRDSSFDQLSDEDRAILKRASRRYRERRSTIDEH